MLEILQAITRPRHKDKELDALLRMQGIMYLKELAESIKTTSLCGLGQAAPNPVLSTLKWFRDEYEAHIYDRTCPPAPAASWSALPARIPALSAPKSGGMSPHISRGEYDQAYKNYPSGQSVPLDLRACLSSPVREDVPRRSNRRRGDSGTGAQAVRS